MAENSSDTERLEYGNGRLTDWQITTRWSGQRPVMMTVEFLSGFGPHELASAKEHICRRMDRFYGPAKIKSTIDG